MEAIFVDNLEANIALVVKALEEISSRQESNSEVISLLEKLEQKDNTSIVEAIRSIPEISEISVKESQAIIGTLNTIKEAVKAIRIDEVSVKESKDITDGLAGILKAIKAKDLSVNVDVSGVETGLSELLSVFKTIKYPDFRLPDDQIETLKPSQDYATREGQEEIVEAVKKIRINVSGGGGGGYPVVGLKAADDTTRINPSTADNQDILTPYQLANFDVSSTPIYVGMTNQDGKWIIKQIDTTTGIAKLAKGNSNYTTNWDNRLSLSYDYFHNIF